MHHPSRSSYRDVTAVNARGRISLMADHNIPWEILGFAGQLLSCDGMNA